METKELLSCAFCGSGDLQLVESAYETGHYVLCCKCEASGPVGDSREEAFDLWINRYKKTSLEELPPLTKLGRQ